MSRYTLVFAILGVAMSWAAKVTAKSSEAGSKISKAEALDLVKRILKVIGMSLEEVQEG